MRTVFVLFMVAPVLGRIHGRTCARQDSWSHLCSAGFMVAHFITFKSDLHAFSNFECRHLELTNIKTSAL